MWVGAYNFNKDDPNAKYPDFRWVDGEFLQPLNSNFSEIGESGVKNKNCVAFDNKDTKDFVAMDCNDESSIKNYICHQVLAKN